MAHDPCDMCDGSYLHVTGRWPHVHGIYRQVSHIGEKCHTKRHTLNLLFLLIFLFIFPNV